MLKFFLVSGEVNLVVVHLKYQIFNYLKKLHDEHEASFIDHNKRRNKQEYYMRIIFE